MESHFWKNLISMLFWIVLTMTFVEKRLILPRWESLGHTYIIDSGHEDSYQNQALEQPVNFFEIFLLGALTDWMWSR